MSVRKLLILSAATAGIALSSVAFAGGPDTPPACGDKLGSGFYLGAGPQYGVGTSMSQWGTPAKFRLGMRGWGLKLFAGYGDVLAEHLYLGGNVFGSFNDINTNGDVSATINGHIKLDYLIGAVVEPGYAPASNVHMYARIGVADGYLEIDDNAGNKNTFSDLGWLLGIGTEVAVSQDFGIRADYSYIDLGKKSSGVPTAIVNPRYSIFNLDLVYHF